MPVVVENTQCSHVPMTQVIQANDLASLDKKNPFRFWQDRDRRGKNAKGKFIPKNFYSNYKSAIMRDAHDLSKNMGSGSLLNSSGELHVCKDPRCDCGNLSLNRSLRKRDPYYNIKLYHERRGLKKVDINALHNPYKPCRKTCSCHHNPLFHAERMQREHMERLHASACRLMIMSVLPKRPGSADSATRKRIEYMQEIDWTRSHMYNDIMTKKYRKMLTQ